MKKKINTNSRECDLMSIAYFQAGLDALELAVRLIFSSTTFPASNFSAETTIKREAYLGGLNRYRDKLLGIKDKMALELERELGDKK